MTPLESMNEFEDKLKEKLPGLFHVNEKGELYVPCGVYCPTGWEPIVEDVLTAIDQYTRLCTKSELNPDTEWFYFFYETFWVPVHNVLHKLLDPSVKISTKGITKKDNLHMVTRAIINKWRTNEEIEAEKKTLRYRLRQNLTQFGDKLRKGKHKYRSKPIPPVKIDQIKEKFGGLRIYITGGDSRVSGMLYFAEYLADKTCMWTGQPGIRYNHNGWIVTASEEQIEKLKIQSGK